MYTWTGGVECRLMLTFYFLICLSLFHLFSFDRQIYGRQLFLNEICTLEPQQAGESGEGWRTSGRRWGGEQFFLHFRVIAASLSILTCIQLLYSWYTVYIVYS